MRASDKVLYIVAPAISVFCAFLIFAVIPFGPVTHIPGTDIYTPLQAHRLPGRRAVHPRVRRARRVRHRARWLGLWLGLPAHGCRPLDRPGDLLRGSPWVCRS
ncbi:hypothetical protein GCM10025876_23010 [Demequina litorisediminis]|uniref:Uncharacterized protein n=1 Tax=Demequina litorisediminis TaxID=1849022 RepID=A0ABQ6IH75_9MICO|nr:hypothetical protein GCM10025876_23010 [Demequina litorisediminis]